MKFQEPSRSLRLLLLAAVIGASMLAYTPSYRGEFFGDEETVYRGYVPALTRFEHAFAQPVRWDSYFRPATILFLIGERRVAAWSGATGAEAERAERAVMSAASYAVHGINTLLVYLLASLLTASLPWGRVGSLFAAAWFGLHPVHTEAVAWRAAQGDLLATFFWLASTWLAVRFWRGGGGWQAAAAGFALLCGILSKESGAAQIATLPLFLWASSGNSPQTAPPAELRRRGIALALAAAAAVAAYAALRAYYYNFSPPYGVSSRPVGLLDILGVLGLYLAKTVFPWPQSPFIGEVPSRLHTLTVFAAGAGMVLASLRWRIVSAKTWLLGAGWTLAAMAPGLVYLLRPAGTILARECVIYAATSGVAFLVAWAAAKLLESPSRKVLSAAGAVVLIAFAAGSYSYAHVFRTKVAFYEAHLRPYGGERDCSVLLALGDAYLGAGRYADALASYQRGLDPAILQNCRPDLINNFRRWGIWGINSAKSGMAKEGAAPPAHP